MRNYKIMVVDVNDEEISILKRLLRQNSLVWQTGDNTYRDIKAIVDIKDEPSKCALLDGSDYVALYNCDITEFFTLRGVTETGDIT